MLTPPQSIIHQFGTPNLTLSNSLNKSCSFKILSELGKKYYMMTFCQSFSFLALTAQAETGLLNIGFIYMELNLFGQQFIFLVLLFFCVSSSFFGKHCFLRNFFNSFVAVNHHKERKILFFAVNQRDKIKILCGSDSP